MSDKGSMEGSDNPMEIINYIAIQAECSEDLAKLTLTAVSGWDGESNGGEVKRLSDFTDKAERVASSVKYNIMRKYNINEDLAFKIFILTKDIIDNGGLPEDQNISPDFVVYCLIKTMNPDGTINKDSATHLAFTIHIFTTEENPSFNGSQYEIVDAIVEIMHNRGIDLQDAITTVFTHLQPPQGGKSKKSKSKKYNRKSRAKKHNKRSKSKKIRKS